MTCSSPAAQRALQLCALSYIEENTNTSKQRTIDGINTGLEGAGYAGWRVVWGPALDQDRSNLMYVAANIASNQFGVSVRRTDWLFWLD